MEAMVMTGPTTDHKEIRVWAEGHGVVPTEVLPHVVDHVPSTLKLMHEVDARQMEDVRRISWEEFFAKFDAMRLAFVYDNDSTGFNEILEIEETSAYRNPKDQLLLLSRN